jgi:hypothetical protein
MSFLHNLLFGGAAAIAVGVGSYLAFSYLTKTEVLN